MIRFACACLLTLTSVGQNSFTPTAETTVVIFPVNFRGEPVVPERVLLTAAGGGSFRREQTSTEVERVPLGNYRLRVDVAGARPFDREIRVVSSPYQYVLAGFRSAPQEDIEFDLAPVTVKVAPPSPAASTSASKVVLVSAFLNLTFAADVKSSIAFFPAVPVGVYFVIGLADGRPCSSQVEFVISDPVTLLEPCASDWPASNSRLPEQR